MEILIIIALSALGTALLVLCIEDIKNHPFIAAFAVTCFLLAGAFAAKVSCDRKNKKAEAVTRESVINQISFEDSVRLYIEELNIAHPEIVFRQARIETGNFTSEVFRDNNNLFGMKPPVQRPNMATGKNKGYAVYDHWKHSVIDYALLQSWSYKRLSREDYLERLASSYAEDSAYIEKVSKWKE